MINISLGNAPGDVTIEPAQLDLPIVLRDFTPSNGDFEGPCCDVDPGIVEGDLGSDRLGVPPGQVEHGHRGRAPAACRQQRRDDEIDVGNLDSLVGEVFDNSAQTDAESDDEQKRLHERRQEADFPGFFVDRQVPLPDPEKAS